MELKIATLDDYFDVREMCLAWLNESPYEGFESDPDKIDAYIEAVLKGDKTRQIALIARKEGRPYGIIAGQVSHLMFSNHRIAHELLWWIRPEARGTKLSIQLLQAFEHWAKTIGCTHIQMSMVNNDNLDKVAKLYTRFGYALAEQMFLKELI